MGTMAMAFFKKSIAVIAVAAILLAGLAVHQGDAAAAKASARYKFSIKDVNGKAHTVTLASDKEKRFVETLPSAFGQEGDIIYNGAYYLTVDGKKQSVKVRNNEVLRINTNQNDIYKLTSVAKGTPDLIIVGQRESSNYYSFEAFAVTPSGTAQKIGFKPYGSKKIEYEMYASSKFKNFSSNYFQLARYDNSEAAGWYFDTYKFSMENYTMTGSSILFYGYEQPYKGVKKGSYEEGQKLIARFSKEPTFGVTDTATSAAAGKTLKFVLDKNTKANLKKGKIPGFNVKLGMSYKQVSQVLGERTTSFYESGGKYWNFAKTPGVGFCFGVDGELDEPLFAVTINKNHLPKMTFASVKAMLGTPDFAGDDDVDGGYLYHYQYDDIYIFFMGPSKNGAVTYINIIQK
ncbi:hypothetical protein [Paenibacillus sp. GCM10027626]|uniref:hypothetical protein n=1 Tax=Paenibacillus sp. GCM10027626 TaxID=3273411 RepID=UPI00363DAEC4